jgi:hypothetical protein
LEMDSNGEFDISLIFLNKWFTINLLIFSDRPLGKKNKSIKT